MKSVDSLYQKGLLLKGEARGGLAPSVLIFPLSFEGEGFTLKGSP